MRCQSGYVYIRQQYLCGRVPVVPLWGTALQMATSSVLLVPIIAHEELCYFGVPCSGCSQTGFCLCQTFTHSMIAELHMRIHWWAAEAHP